MVKRAKSPTSRRPKGVVRTRNPKGVTAARRTMTRRQPVMGGPIMPNPGSLVVGLGRTFAAGAGGNLGFGRVGPTRSTRSQQAQQQRSQEAIWGSPVRQTVGGRRQPPSTRQGMPLEGSARAVGRGARIARRAIPRNSSPTQRAYGAAVAGQVSVLTNMGRRRGRRRGGSARSM